VVSEAMVAADATTTKKAAADAAAWRAIAGRKTWAGKGFPRNGGVQPSVDFVGECVLCVVYAMP
jgi:hypothetical protein